MLGKFVGPLAASNWYWLELPFVLTHLVMGPRTAARGYSPLGMVQKLSTRGSVVSHALDVFVLVIPVHTSAHRREWHRRTPSHWRSNKIGN